MVSVNFGVQLLTDLTSPLYVDRLGYWPSMKLAQLLSAADGGEVLCIGRKASGWYGDSFLAEANEKLKAAGKQEPLTRGEDIPGCGFELVKDGSSLNCTFEMLAEGQRMALEGDVARALFDE